MAEVKIPIKALVEKFEAENNSTYEFEEKNIIRRFFIACLNLGYLTPEELADAVDKFAKGLHKIEFTLNKNNGLEFYKLYNGTLYVREGLKEHDESLYDKTIFKAISEIMLGFNEQFQSFSNAMAEMVAEKIYNMDTTGTRIIMPKTERYKIGSEMLELRTGYERYNLYINLIKQLFIAKNINENKVIRDMINGNFNEVFSKVTSDNQVRFLLELLEAIFLMDTKRLYTGQTNPKEFKYIVKYQKMVNDIFISPRESYLAFCALITSEELRIECMNKFSFD